MDPDSESPLSRVERTFWTVWYYISGAVNRFLRPEPSNNVSSDPNSSQGSADTSGPVNSGHTGDDARGGGIDEEQPPVPASLLESSRTVVAWDTCLEPDELHKTQLNKASEEHESTTEEEYGQARNDDTGHIPAKKEEEEENIEQNLCTHRQVESQDSDKKEKHAKIGSLNLTDDDVMIEDMDTGIRKDSAEEESPTTETPETDPEKKDETMTDIKVKEEEDEIYDEDEQDLEAENSEMKLCTITDYGVKEDDGMHIEEESAQKKDADTKVICEDAEVLKVAPDSEDESDEGHKTQLSKASEEAESTTKEEYGQAGNDDTGHITAEEEEEEEDNTEQNLCTHRQVESQDSSKNEEHAKMGSLNLTDDAMTEDMDTGIRKDSAEEESPTTETPETDPEKKDETIIEIKVKEEDDEIYDEDEQDLQAENSETKLSTTTDYDVKEDDGMHIEEGSANSEDKSAEGHKTQLKKASEEHESTTKEEYGQAGNVDAGHIPAKKDDDDEEEEEEENIEEKFDTHRQVESQDSDKNEEHAKMGSLNLTDDDVMIEDMDTGIRKDSAEEESPTTETPETDPEKKDETIIEIKVKEEEDEIYDEDEQDLQAENSELCTITDYDVKEDDIDACVLKVAPDSDEESDEREKAEDQISASEQLSEDDINVKEDTMARRSQSEKVDDEGDDGNGNILHETEHCEQENRNEAAHNQAIDEKNELEEDVETVTDGSQEILILTEHVTCSKDVALNAKTELHSAGFTDEEQEGVAKITQTKTREIGDAGAAVDEKPCEITADVLVKEILVDQVEEERLTSEEDDKKSYMETACTVTPVTVKPEAETGQETSRELRNIPLRTCEGQVVVSPELNPPTCEETKEGVPEYNNEPGPDENHTQRFLEVVNCTKIQTALLQEEVESQKAESLQNSGSITRADYLLVREHIEEEQENAEDINKENTGVLSLIDTESPQETDKPHVEQVIQEPELSFDTEGGHFLDHSMKTGIERPEKESETHDGLADEPDETTTVLQDETEELLVEFETDEGLSDSKDAAGDAHESTGAVAAGEELGFADETSKLLDIEVPKMMDTSIFHEWVDTVTSDLNCNIVSSLLDDVTESGFLKESIETEPNVLGDCTVEMQAAVTHTEVTGYDLKEEAAEDEELNKDHMEILNLQLVETAAEPSEALTAESELDKAFEISHVKTLKDTEAADELMTTEFKANDLAVRSTEEMAKPVTQSGESYAEEVSGHQDVIDEEILDLWIEAVSSEDADQRKQQEGPELGQQTDTTIDEINKKEAGISSVQTETENEDSGESGLVSDKVSSLEVSSSTAESGFLDQSLTFECDALISETQPLKSTSTESFQDTCDVLASMSESADSSELSEQQPKSESEDVLVVEAAKTEQSHLKEEEAIIETGFSTDSGPDAGHQKQESYKSQEKSDEEQVESLETEVGSQKDNEAEITDIENKIDLKDDEEVDVESQLKVEKTKVEDEALEITGSDFLAEIKHNEPGPPEHGSEASLEEGNWSAKTGSQGDRTDSGKLFKLPFPEEPRPESDDTAEHLTTKSEDLYEVDGSLLDVTAQRSRIALKNPRVRPPKDPRYLLNMPSLEPTPSSHLPLKVPAGVPLGGLGIGIKLPGLGAGFPALKKTRVVKEENSPEASREPQTKPEDKGDIPKPDEAPQKPKWMPPKHPGFGNPLMSELKTKLKKTTKE